VVVDSHAVIDPRAVVVETLDALIAAATVARAGSSDDLAIRANLNRIN
jgi:hypothetical protein